MKAEQALNDMKVIRKRMGRVHIVLRGGRLTVMEPHPDRPQQVASITPTLAERPARRPWWSR